MNVRESLSVALESLAANKMRAALTMLGIIIGVSAVITMLALAKGTSGRMMQQIQQMGTNVLMVMSGQSRSGAVRGGMGSMQTLTLEDAEAIAEKCPAIVKAAPEVQSGAQVKFRNKNTNTSILGTSPDYPGIRNYKVAKGRSFPLWARVGFAAGALFGIGWAILGIRIFSRGAIDLKFDTQVYYGMSWGLPVMMMTLALVYAPEGIVGVRMIVCCLAFLVMGAVFLLRGVVEQTEMKTREKLLEIEYQLAELTAAIAPSQLSEKTKSE